MSCLHLKLSSLIMIIIITIDMFIYFAWQRRMVSFIDNSALINMHKLAIAKARQKSRKKNHQRRLLQPLIPLISIIPTCSSTAQAWTKKKQKTPRMRAAGRNGMKHQGRRNNKNILREIRISPTKGFII